MNALISAAIIVWRCWCSNGAPCVQTQFGAYSGFSCGRAYLPVIWR